MSKVPSGPGPKALFACVLLPGPDDQQGPSTFRSTFQQYQQDPRIQQAAQDGNQIRMSGTAGASFTTCTHTWSSHLKRRRGVFDDAMLQRCEEIMRDVCTDFGAELREFNGESDHVHLLVHYPPSVALSRLVDSLKGVSSRRLREESQDRSIVRLCTDDSGRRRTFQAHAVALR